MNWRNRGACKPGDTDQLFFAPEGETLGSRRRREAAAVAICGRCPVRETCLQWALDNRIPFGVWGGLGEAELREMRGARPRWAAVA